MNRSTAIALLNDLIETQEAEGRNDTTPCLMLTGRWYKAFPDPPPAVVPLPENRGIFLLNLAQGRAIRDALANGQMDNVAIEIKSKASPDAVNERHRARERDRIRSIVKRSPGRYAREQLRRNEP